VSALPAAERAALLKRRSPTTLAAALAAFGPVVPWWACAKALAAALLAVFDVLVASTRPAFEATDLLVFSDINYLLSLSQVEAPPWEAG
jgi:hypothetical protein